jgi:hypothetical protein
MHIARPSENQEFHSLSLILLGVPKNPLLENPR